MIEIKLTELPEFDSQLKITITLEKDGEGIRESITTSPDPSPSLLDIPDDCFKTPARKKGTGLKKSPAQKITNVIRSNGPGAGIKLGSSIENPLPDTTNENPTAQTTSSETKRKSGNLMSLEF